MKEAKRATEDQIHEAVAQTLSRLIARPGELSPNGVVWWSIETRNAKSVVEGAKRKRRGVVAGIPDISISWLGRSLGIELKVERSYPSAVQKALHASIRGAGGSVEIARSVGEVLDILAAYGVPHRKWS